MVVDEKTKAYFSNIKQVFLYLSDRCNLLCEQCLYKPNVVRGKSIELETAEELLLTFRNLGAFKLSILGGEISLYDCENQYKKLIHLLKFAHSIGYQYIRIDTNGQYDPFFENPDIYTYIDEVSFSIDGYDAATDDKLRGRDSFDKAVANLYRLQNTVANIKINITSCITKQNTALSGGIIPFIEKMIHFAAINHIAQLNFHGVFKMGVPMDVWTGDSHLDPHEWYIAVQSIRRNVTEKNILLIYAFQFTL